MKPTSIDNVLATNELAIIKEYMRTISDRSDVRPDITSQHPVWESDDWPKEIVSRVLNEHVPFKYQIDDIVFFDSTTSHTLHIDDQRKFNDSMTVLFEIEVAPRSETVFFNNFYNSTNGGIFTKKLWNPYTYTLNGTSGPTKVDDIRDLLSQCRQNPEAIAEFNVTQDFIDMLEKLISKRSGIKGDEPKDGVITDVDYAKPGPRFNNYSILSNYDPNKKFDADFHKKYLGHIELEDLHGLEVSDIIEWRPGSIIMFDSSQLHASSNSHISKKFITIFLHKL